MAGADLAWFGRGGGGFPKGGALPWGPGALSPWKCLKFEALKCHFLHSERYIYSLNLNLSS
jgi:hypothetical protein